MTPHHRRGFVKARLGVTLVAVTAFAMTGCAAANVTPGQTPSASAAPTVAPSPEPSSIPTLPPIPPAVPGNALTVYQGPRSSNEVALTFDERRCESCIGTLVTNLALTGASATFCPNGMYAMNFAPYVARIRVLIAEGRVEMCNHTFSHPDLATLSDAQIRSELLEVELPEIVAYLTSKGLQTVTLSQLLGTP